MNNIELNLIKIFFLLLGFSNVAEFKALSLGNEMTRDIDADMDSNDEVVSRFFEEYESNSEKRDAEESHIPEIRTSCNYTLDENKLHCFGPSDQVECQAVQILGENNFRYFAIEKLDFESEKISKIMLYPRTLGKTKWLNHTLLSNDNKYITYSLYSSDEINDYGLKVEDLCFQKLLKLFKNSQYISSIYLIENSLSEFKSHTIPIVANLIIKD